MAVKTMVRRTAKFLYLTPLLFMSSCYYNDYINVESMADEVWYKDGKADFVFTPDSGKLYSIDLMVRTLPEFEHNNIQMTVETFSPDSLYWADTVSLAVNPAGAENYASSTGGYRRKVRFTGSGEYRFRIGQITQDNPLVGVDAVGLIINRD